ncbi:MAG: hypothetical protein H6625_05505 [Bdellovibrionaceae bacterium]|nr:hypothetical protein [Pseudobdellovibrionaceae bacterium]
MRWSTLILIFLFQSQLSAQNRNSEITCEPKWENKRIIGFTCPELHEESLLSKLGLNSSDILLEYNGRAIDSYRDMQRFYELLHARGTMKIKIKRNNQTLMVENKNK